MDAGLKSESYLCLYDVGLQKSLVSEQLVPPFINQEAFQIFSFAAIKSKLKMCDAVQLELSHVKDNSRSIFIESLVIDVILITIFHFS